MEHVYTIRPDGELMLATVTYSAPKDAEDLATWFEHAYLDVREHVGPQEWAWWKLSSHSVTVANDVLCVSFVFHLKQTD
jgi:hypothetical protein